MITPQTLIENAVLDLLEHTGSYTLDETIGALPQHTWSEVFFAVDTMSRDGRIVLRRMAGSGYQVSLPASYRTREYLRVTRLPVRSCIGCGCLCDEIHPDLGSAHWVEASHYLTKYAFTWDQLNRIASTCPTCARLLASSGSEDHPTHVTSAAKNQQGVEPANPHYS